MRPSTSPRVGARTVIGVLITLTDTMLEHHDDNDTILEHHDNNGTNHDRRQNTSRPEQQCRRCRAAQRPGGRRPGRGTGGTEYGLDGDTGCAGTGPTTDNWSGHLDAGLAGALFVGFGITTLSAARRSRRRS
jgi:hypothetical protein